MAINESQTHFPDTERNKQAIYTGLLTLLSEQQANEVLADWGSYFSDKRSVFNGLNSFARDVCKKFDKNDQQRFLIRELNRALLSKDNNQFQHLVNEELKRKVEPANANTNASTVANSAALADQANTAEHVSAAISTPEFETFQLLLLEILDLVAMHNQDMAAHLRLFLNEVIQSMPWSEAQQQQLLTLISTGATTQVRSYKTDQLKSFLKHIRNWINDEMGEIAGEDLINQAINEVQITAVAENYPAKNFI